MDHEAHVARVRDGLCPDAELRALLLRVLPIDLELEVRSQGDERVRGLRVERLVEPALERLERDLAVAVVHDQSIDRLFANGVQGAVLGCDWHGGVLYRASDLGASAATTRSA